jgi:hypothetical protein
MNPLVDEALKYLAFGWSIIPVSGKRATVKWEKFQTRKPSPAEVRGMFSRSNVTGVAVVFGGVSGWLYCRDFDEQESYDRWAKEFPALAKSLPTVKTHRGAHVYFLHTADRRTEKLGDGEVRGIGGYCLLPPSKHPEGSVYAWIVPFGKSVPFADPEKCGLSRCLKNAGVNPLPLSNSVSSVASVSLCSSVDSVVSVHSVAVGKQLEKLAGDLAAKEEHRNHALCWNLARGVRGLERDLDRKLTGKETDFLFCRWYERSKPFLRPELSKDDYRAEFLDALRNAKYPPGEGEFIDAIRGALADSLPPEAQRYEDPRFQRAVAVCRAAQRAAGEDVFYLSVRTLQALLGLDDHNRAARILRVLEHDGLLHVVTKGSPQTNKASRYRYPPIFSPDTFGGNGHE